jgi:hypothetical protein
MGPAMKSGIKRALLYLCATLALLAISVSGYIGYFLYDLRNRMGIGKEFMENLDDESLKVWIRDAGEIRKNDTLRTKKNGMWIIANLEPGLQDKYGKYGIRRLDVSEAAVSFVWTGGLDHTDLTMRYKNDSLIRITAQYNDYTYQELYPKLKPVQFDVVYPNMADYRGNRRLSDLPPD